MTGSDVPDGVIVETVYVVEISYSADAPARRPAVRPEHLGRIARLLAEGRMVEAGGFLDFTGALLMVRASSETEALDLVRDDVYLRSGVWLDDARARPFGRVVLAPDPATDAAGG